MIERRMITRRRALAAGLSLLPASAGLSRVVAAPVRCAEGQFRLPNGRRIGYADYGDPAGPLVFYFHGTPGSRIETGLLDAEISASGVRLVALERPGIGKSDYQPGRRILDWPADVACIADMLGYANSAFGVIGLSGGTPYALACVKRLPQRLTHVAIVSGHAPPGAPVQYGGAERAMSFIVRRPRLGRVGLNIADRRSHRRPEKFAEEIMSSWAPVDQELMQGNPAYRRTLMLTLQEATRCGTAGVQTDVTLLGSPWGYRLCDLPPSSVSIWHGECDTIAPISMAHYFHRNIPGSELMVDPRAAHVTMMKWYAAEILGRFSLATTGGPAPLSAAAGT
jgi:pimeloyl-ACP methyl ester carboxylesterase